jgi:hypothetical protein
VDLIGKAGYADNRVPWTRIAENNHHFIRSGALPSSLQILKPETMGKTNIHTVLSILKKHEDWFDEQGNPTDKALLFLPCGSGASFLPKAKRPVRAPGKIHRSSVSY